MINCFITRLTLNIQKNVNVICTSEFKCKAYNSHSMKKLPESHISHIDILNNVLFVMVNLKTALLGSFMYLLLINNKDI